MSQLRKSSNLHARMVVSNDEINRQEEELASMSTVGRYIYARHSQHAIQLHEPGVVTEAIQSVLKATRSRS